LKIQETKNNPAEYAEGKKRESTSKFTRRGGVGIQSLKTSRAEKKTEGAGEYFLSNV